MTPQDIFNKVAEHLLKQNARCQNDEDSCKYRGENNTSCAVGCLLPDSLYSIIMEGETIIGLFEKFPKVKTFLGAKNTYLLRKLQDIHDDEKVENWSILLIEVAEEEKLDLPPCLRDDIVPMKETIELPIVLRTENIYRGLLQQNV